MWSMTRIPTGALVGFEAEAWLAEGGGEAGRGVGWFLGGLPQVTRRSSGTPLG